MSARLARLSPSAILVVLCIFVPLARLLAQAPSAPAGDTASGADAKAQAAAIWESRCAPCHGMEGRGDGPGAAALKPRPINFHLRNWQKTVTNDQIAKAIVEGGGAVGLSDQMAANPDLEDEPGIVKALVAHVRELGKVK
jgi:cytochrome c553